ncbi:hypothetical protein K3152_00420 [Qipengyuania sp. 1NDH17]|uniref:Prepilin type IV endopeptidase peptidase domain-containing protein n=1 Tax=Qipengyuania polymorpha TaxID=2867234 RepID=A0ABS7IXB3_9SPHN|nr:hypothetical protein [Qipengyuania polymorpha]MBX7456700.1 hypothetical protein [Qipengyuania polymorpha]
MDALDPQLVKAALLFACFVPLLVANLRSGTVPNVLLGILLVVGVVTTILFGTLTPGMLVWWGAGFILFLLAAAKGMIPGGVAKLFIALLPWFDFQPYLLVVAIGMGLAAIIGKMRGGNALVVPPMMVAALGVTLFPLLG